MPIIDFANFTFTAEEIRNLNELMRLKVIEAGPFAQFHDVHTGIVTGKRIGWLGEMGMLGKASRGCDPAVDVAEINTVEKLWDPKEFDVRLKQCYEDIESTMAVYARKQGTAVADLTNTDYMNIILEMAGKSMEKFMWRLWVMDTTHSNVGSGAGSELLTAGVDPTFFTIVNGYWNQIEAIIAAAPMQHTILTANAEATTALQFSELTPAAAFNAVMDATYNMRTELVTETNKFGIITRYFANQVKRNFQTLNTHPDAYEATIDGVPVLKVNGVDFVISDDLTELIVANFNLGANHYLPHRAVITTKENLAFGIEGESTFATFDVWYEKMLRSTYIDLIDRIDVKIMQDHLIHAIY